MNGMLEKKKCFLFVIPAKRLCHDYGVAVIPVLDTGMTAEGCV